MSTKAVFFDLDDTLYPYPPCNDAGKTAAMETAIDLGYEFDRDEFETLYQRGRREVKREIAGTAASHERFLYFKRGLELHTGTARPSDASALGDAFWSAYLDAMTLHPDVEETLAELQARSLDVAIVTNLTTRIQLRKLDRLGIEPYIDLLLTSEETGQEKPGSVMFTLPLARLDRRPSETVMVGDDVEADIVGANAVGLETVLIGAAGGSESEQSTAESLRADRKPDHRIDDLADVLEVIE